MTPKSGNSQDVDFPADELSDLGSSPHARRDVRGRATIDSDAHAAANLAISLSVLVRNCGLEPGVVHDGFPCGDLYPSCGFVLRTEDEGFGRIAAAAGPLFHDCPRLAHALI